MLSFRYISFLFRIKVTKTRQTKNIHWHTFIIKFFSSTSHIISSIYYFLNLRYSVDNKYRNKKQNKYKLFYQEPEEPPPPEDPPPNPPKPSKRLLLPLSPPPIHHGK